MKLINFWAHFPNRLEHASKNKGKNPFATLKICMPAGRGCLYFVLFSSLNKALRSCGLFHKSCLLLRSWYAHVTLLWVTLLLTLQEQPKTKCLEWQDEWGTPQTGNEIHTSANTAIVCFTKRKYLKNTGQYSTYHQTKLQLWALWFLVSKVVSTSTKEVYL